MNGSIILRDFTDSDIRLFEKWLCLPHVAEWYHEPMDWLDEVRKRKTDFYFLHHFITEYAGTPIGFCQYYAYENSGETWHGSIPVQGTYSMDYMIGDTSYLGKGFGRAMVRALMEKITAHIDARRIIVQPEPENQASCRTLLSCGFRYDEANELYLLPIKDNNQDDHFICNRQ